MTKKDRIKKRFLAMVSSTPDANGCRAWLGHVREDGYGTFQLAMGGEHASELAHRVAFAIKIDDFSILRFFGGREGGKRGLVVRHVRECPLKSCVEFAHVEWGTQAENIADNAANGKLLRGEAVGTSKMTEEQVKWLLEFYASWPKSEKTGKPKRGYGPIIAERLGITREMVHQIVYGKWWKHLQ